jgi:TolA-binding protein
MRKTIITKIILAIALTGFIALGVNQITTDRQVKLENNIKIETVESKLKLKQLKLQELNEELDKQLNKSEKDKEKIKQLETDVQRLQSDLQAKRRKESQEAQKLARANVVKPQTVSASSGDCETWMRQAGVPINNATRTLIAKESGCRPGAVNPSSGACGIPQAYPCSKLPCSLNDAGAVCQLQWMQNYVMQRYGSWESALSFWYSKCGSPQGCWY